MNTTSNKDTKYVDYELVNIEEENNLNNKNFSLSEISNVLKDDLMHETSPKIRKYQEDYINLQSVLTTVHFHFL